MMLSQVAAVQITVTRSEAEALILENNLIKSLSPRYNILFRDDKSYPYLMVSGGDFPWLRFHPGAVDQGHHSLRPFPPPGAERRTIQVVEKRLWLRPRQDLAVHNPHLPFLRLRLLRV